MIEWKDIEGYEGLYKISNTGEVVSEERINNNRVIHSKTMAKIRESENGHEYVSLSDGKGNRKKHLVYILVAKAFVPNPNNYKNVREKDGNILNTNADNLEWYRPITKKERSKMYYLQRDKSKCVNCGKPLDRDGCYCYNCLELKREESKESREFYKSIGICPTCRKNRIFYGEKQCTTCRAKSAGRMAICREQDKERVNETQRLCQRRIYAKRQESGLCTRCGKERDDKRYKMCSLCRFKRWEKTRRNGIGERERRIQSGLCFFCGQPALKGYKTCEKHYKMCVENVSKTDRSYWRQLNSTIFKR